MLFWRRERDSNPRTGFNRYTISNRAPSTNSAISASIFTCVALSNIGYYNRLSKKVNTQFSVFSAVRPPHDRKEVEPCGGPRKVIYIYTLRIALFFGRVNGFHRTTLTNFLSSIPEEKNRRRPESLRRPGAERGIRTLERVLTVTRFPIVRLRPTQPSLHPYLLALHQQHWLL